MATETDLLKMELARIERELEAVRAKIKRLESREPDSRLTFVDLHGIWKGTHFTYEEIKAADYKLDEEDWE